MVESELDAFEANRFYVGADGNQRDFAPGALRDEVETAVAFPAEEMRRVRAEEGRVLPITATDPRSVKVEKTTGKGMDIDWKDSHKSHYSFSWLRDACPCATCNEEREATGRKIGEPPKPKPGALPMYKEPVRPLEISPVGKYAINFHWNDGHSSGIARE